jgi:hypothetical protein
VLRADGSGWIGDEYGANAYHFNKDKQIDAVLPMPEALKPRNASGDLVFSSEVTPATGRRGNQGMEGLTLSPDGKKLIGLMQSAAVQDSGTATQGRFNTRLLVWDVSESDTPTTLSAEYVLQLPTFNDTGTGAANRTGAQSEIIALDDHRFLVLSRDGNGKGTTTANAPVFKSVLLLDLTGASNILGQYDAQGGDITPGAGTTLAPGITPISWVEAVNMLDTTQLAKLGLNLKSGATSDLNSLSEKWEGLSMLPTGTPNEYLLIVANDNDFLSNATKMAGLDGTTINTVDAVGASGGPVKNDTMFLTYRVSVTPVPEPGSTLLLAAGAASLLGFWRRRKGIR